MNWDSLSGTTRGGRNSNTLAPEVRLGEQGRDWWDMQRNGDFAVKRVAHILTEQHKFKACVARLKAAMFARPRVFSPRLEPNNRRNRQLASHVSAPVSINAPGRFRRNQFQRIVVSIVK